MEKQYVYIFSISDKPDLIKVGKTSKNPYIRANDLSKQTAATGKFSVEWYMEVPDAELAENIAHFKLSEYHDNKEYFSIKSYVAYLILEKFLIPLFEIKKPIIIYDGKVKRLIDAKKSLKITSKKARILLSSALESSTNLNQMQSEKNTTVERIDIAKDKAKEILFQIEKEKNLRLAKKANNP